MQCPTCHVDLVMSDRSGVEIDYCPRCRGVWLDRGELDKILERAGAGNHHAPSAQQQHHQQHDDRAQQYRHDDDDEYRRRESHGSHDGHHGKPHKKESFLGDIFDF